MITANDVHCYYWIEEIPAEICDKIRQAGQKEEQHKAVTFDNSVPSTDKKGRDSSVSWIEDRWLTGLAHTYANMANNQVWHYELMKQQEFLPCQYTTYDKNGHYTWHQDIGDQKNFIKDVDCQRKISVVIQLSDPSEYEGGDFEIKNVRENLIELPPTIKNKGSVLVFPSYVVHRITPITSGTRNSLVAWYLGPPFV